MGIRTYNVLAVDDEKFSLVIIKSCLKDQKYNVVTCDNAPDAIAAFKKGNFDVILLDVMLGAIDGFEMRRLIRGISPHVPIIFLTSLLDDINSTLINQISEDQYSYYLNKSFKKQQLIEKVEHAVKVYRQDNEAEKFYKQLEVDLRLAREVQRVLLPVWCTLKDDMLSTYLYEPCFQVSGDCFDLVDLDNGKYLFFLGDIAGHGVQAALYMSAIQSFLKMIRNESPEQDMLPHMILNRINAFFNSDLKCENYMTCLVAIFDFRKKHVVFQSAGHPSLIRLSSRTKTATEVNSDGKGSFPVGWFPDSKYTADDNVDCDFEDGDVFVGYTDGLTDMQNDSGESLDSNLLYSLLGSFMEKEYSFMPIPFLLRTSLEQIGYTNATDDLSIVEIRVNPTQACSGNERQPANDMMRLISLSKAEVSKCVEKFSVFVQDMTDDMELATKVELLLSEFLNNVVEHDSSHRTLGSGILIQVRLSEPDTVVVIVLDREPKWENDSLQLKASPNEILERANRNMASSGRGLAIIRTITSQIMRKHYKGLNQTEFQIKAEHPWKQAGDGTEE